MDQTQYQQLVDAVVGAAQALETAGSTAKTKSQAFVAAQTIQSQATASLASANAGVTAAQTDLTAAQTALDSAVSSLDAARTALDNFVTAG